MPPWKERTRANAAFFDDPGSPGGAAALGMLGAGHPLIAALPPQRTETGP